MWYNGGMTGKKQKKDEIVIFSDQDVKLEVDMHDETVWLTQEQMVKLFQRDQSVISRHIRNIFREGELEENEHYLQEMRIVEDGEGGTFMQKMHKSGKTGEEKSNMQNMHNALGEETYLQKKQINGNEDEKNKLQNTFDDEKKLGRPITLYSLDVVISVGYRVRSKRGTKFRIWANSVLKDYLMKGYAINQKRLEEVDRKKLEELQGTISVVRRLIQRQELSSGEANGVLEVISRYTESFQTLKEYDDGKISLKGLNKAKVKFRMTGEMGEEYVMQLKETVRGGELFGKMRDESFYGDIEAIYQEFNGRELYPSVAEKAANLLYFLIKDHPFYDGNKRIAAMLFIVFLTMNDYHLTEVGETKISDRALTAITLLIAESKAKEKELIVELVEKLLK